MLKKKKFFGSNDFFDDQNDFFWVKVNNFDPKIFVKSKDFNFPANIKNLPVRTYTLAICTHYYTYLR